MKTYILIEASAEDGDCLTTFEEISEKDLLLIKPVIEAISKNTEEENYEGGESDYGHLVGYEKFDELVPFQGRYIHTILTVKIFNVELKEDLL